MQLLERDAVLEAARAGVDAALRGSGSVLVLEGPPGLGKTSVAGATVELAAARGMCVLRAHGGDLEQGFPFGIVHQLFQSKLLALPGAQRDALLSGAARLAGPVLGLTEAIGPPTADASFMALHGLFWLVANMAAAHPLLLIVDDAHRADEPSLRWVSYLTRRLEGLPLFLVLAARRAETAGDEALNRWLPTGPPVVVHELEPLGSTAVAGVVRSRMEGDVDPLFSGACHEVTGGNPLLLHELLGSLLADGVNPTAESVELVRGIVPVSVTRWALLRLVRLAPAARALAQAVAVLGGSAEIRHATRVGDIEPREASAAADALAAADLFASSRPLQFIHPLIKTAVYAQLSEGQRVDAHARAARILYDDGAAPDHVAVHLLETEAAADPWVVACLRRTAREAMIRGAPDIAARHLARAAAESAPVEERAEVLLELGSAEVFMRPASAVAHLDRAREIAASPATRRRIEVTLAQALMHADRSVEAVQVMEEAVSACGQDDPELRLDLEARLIAAAWNHTSTVAVAWEHIEQVGEGLEGRTPAERLVLAELACKVAYDRGSAVVVAKLAETAIAQGRLLSEEGPGSQIPYMAINALGMAGDFDRAIHWHGQLIADAAARGSVMAFAMASAVRSLLWYQRGALAEAEADAQGALDATSGMPWLLAPLARAVLSQSAIERGDLEGAGRVLDCTDRAEALPDQIFTTSTLHARAQLAIGLHRFDQALADLRECERRSAAFLSDHPSTVPWRSTAAIACAGLGDMPEARRLVGDEIAICRTFAAPRPLGVALRVAGAVHCGEQAARHREEAVTVLAGSGATLEYAHALTDHGSGLNRAGQRGKAVPLLRLGLDLAHRCGAEALAARAWEELLASGARPRRRHISGAEALTARERRVAWMAAAGSSNRQIAEALFVTERTVEGHLSSTYAKLGVASRTELTPALEGTPGFAMPGPDMALAASP